MGLLSRRPLLSFFPTSLMFMGTSVENGAAEQRCFLFGSHMIALNAGNIHEMFDHKSEKNRQI